MSKNIVRVNKNKNYTIMSNYHLNDDRLSWKAKGIHSYILSLPDDWKVIIEHLKKVSTDGVKSTRSGIDELYKLRYWQKYPVYVNGRVEQWVTEIYEEPFPENEKIKNIIIKEDKKIINYENNTEEVIKFKEKLLPQKGKVGESIDNTDIELLPQKVEVGSVEVDNVEVDKDTLLITNNTNNTNSTNNSFILSKEKMKNMKERKKEPEDLELELKEEEFKEILDKSEIEIFEEHTALEFSLRMIYFSDRWFEFNGIKIPINKVRDDLHNIDAMIIQDALNRYKNSCKEKAIKYPAKYLASCIYHSLINSDFIIKSEFINDNKFYS